MSKRKEDKPSVLICTPAYGGAVMVGYVQSLLLTTQRWILAQQPHSVYMVKNESLIPRGRNRCVHYALEHGFDKVLFIDADLAWGFEDVTRLLRCRKRVVGGTYPGKTYPIQLMTNALPEDDDVFGANRTCAELKALREKSGDEFGQVAVRHVPTGFMLIDCSIFRELQAHVPSFKIKDVQTGEMQTMWDYFPIGVSDYSEGFYDSEDWGFCALVRHKLGEKVWLDTHIVLPHTGSWDFRKEHEESFR